MVNQEILPIALKQLHLSIMRSSWEEVASQADELRWTYPQYLAALCDRELASREQRKIQRNITEAKLPPGKTLDSFEFKNLSSITAAQISTFAENTSWVTQANNLILFGPSGVGKSHLAAAIGRRLIEHGMRVFFTKTTALVQKLQSAYSEHKLSDLLTKLGRYQLIILDDIGYVKKSDAETSVLFELIADRYESKSFLITSNQTFDQWDEIFPNNNMAVAAIDRLVHHATIININEPSYRKPAPHSEKGSFKEKDHL
jgi:DNA replication protein DnaC